MDEEPISVVSITDDQVAVQRGLYYQNLLTAPQTSFQNFAASNFLTLDGQNTKGRQIVVVQASNLIPYDVHELLAFVVQSLDSLVNSEYVLIFATNKSRIPIHSTPDSFLQILYSFPDKYFTNLLECWCVGTNNTFRQIIDKVADARYPALRQLVRFVQDPIELDTYDFDCDFLSLDIPLYIEGEKKQIPDGRHRTDTIIRDERDEPLKPSVTEAVVDYRTAPFFSLSLQPTCVKLDYSGFEEPNIIPFSNYPLFCEGNREQRSLTLKWIYEQEVKESKRTGTLKGTFDGQQISCTVNGTIEKLSWIPLLVLNVVAFLEKRGEYSISKLVVQEPDNEKTKTYNIAHLLAYNPLHDFPLSTPSHIPFHILLSFLFSLNHTTATLIPLHTVLQIVDALSLPQDQTVEISKNPSPLTLLGLSFLDAEFMSLAAESHEDQSLFETTTTVSLPFVAFTSPDQTKSEDNDLSILPLNLILYRLASSLLSIPPLHLPLFQLLVHLVTAIQKGSMEQTEDGKKKSGRKHLASLCSSFIPFIFPPRGKVLESYEKQREERTRISSLVKGKKDVEKEKKGWSWFKRKEETPPQALDNAFFAKMGEIEIGRIETYCLTLSVLFWDKISLYADILRKKNERYGVSFPAPISLSSIPPAVAQIRHAYRTARQTHTTTIPCTASHHAPSTASDDATYPADSPSPLSGSGSVGLTASSLSLLSSVSSGSIGGRAERSGAVHFHSFTETRRVKNESMDCVALCEVEEDTEKKKSGQEGDSEQPKIEWLEMLGIAFEATKMRRDQKLQKWVRKRHNLSDGDDSEEESTPTKGRAEKVSRDRQSVEVEKKQEEERQKKEEERRLVEETETKKVLEAQIAAESSALKVHEEEDKQKREEEEKLRQEEEERLIKEAEEEARAKKEQEEKARLEEEERARKDEEKKKEMEEQQRREEEERQQKEKEEKQRKEEEERLVREAEEEERRKKEEEERIRKEEEEKNKKEEEERQRREEEEQLIREAEDEERRKKEEEEQTRKEEEQRIAREKAEEEERQRKEQEEKQKREEEERVAKEKADEEERLRKEQEEKQKKEEEEQRRQEEEERLAREKAEEEERIRQEEEERKKVEEEQRRQEEEEKQKRDEEERIAKEKADEEERLRKEEEEKQKKEEEEKLRQEEEERKRAEEEKLAKEKADEEETLRKEEEERIKKEEEEKQNTAEQDDQKQEEPDHQTSEAKIDSEAHTQPTSTDAQPASPTIIVHFVSPAESGDWCIVGTNDELDNWKADASFARHQDKETEEDQHGIRRVLNKNVEYEFKMVKMLDGQTVWEQDPNRKLFVSSEFEEPVVITLTFGDARSFHLSSPSTPSTEWVFLRDHSTANNTLNEQGQGEAEDDEEKEESPTPSQPGQPQGQGKKKKKPRNQRKK
ncbi:putative signal recognition particle-docking protein FtsY [Blattamonas nauphoetae]|uniref:Signal recognition particle-docking protein FtsY n=1 Tax=Blattamonas nauphoetae TaxID=2049346 RepID=A0ABQ9X5Y0_9EUKA|nr:putative signal recognition particle-docking protein FtsY [Blattamonas nauphoetae]